MEQRPQPSLELASEQGPVESIEELVSRRDLGAIVQRAMSKLSDEQRTTIILKEYQGLTFQEIADLQGCPLSTVKTRLYQGLTVLRRELDRQGVPVPGAAQPAAAPHRGVEAPATRPSLTASLRLSPPLTEPL